MKKKLIKKISLWSSVLILLDITIGTIAVKYFDLIGFAQKYNAGIMHTVFVVIPVWLFYAPYKKNRFTKKIVIKSK